jgi:hypothetical protein
MENETSMKGGLRMKRKAGLVTTLGLIGALAVSGCKNNTEHTVYSRSVDNNTGRQYLVADDSPGFDTYIIWNDGRWIGGNTTPVDSYEADNSVNFEVTKVSSIPSNRRKIMKLD